jgi:two-component system sensor histidine kinase KdpD
MTRASAALLSSLLVGGTDTANSGGWRLVRNLLLGLMISAAFTPVVVAVHAALSMRDVGIFYLLPVVIAAHRCGMASALAAAVAGTAASAYFFYKPIFSLHVVSPQDVVALTIFVAVAAITSHLSVTARTSAAEAARHARELRLLYAFSRKLGAAGEPADIYAAIQEHASAIVGGKVSVVLTGGAGEGVGAPDPLPEPVRAALQQARTPDADPTGTLISGEAGAMHWLLRPLPAQLQPAGFLLVEIPAAAGQELDSARRGIDALLDDAMASLERLDLASTVAEAELRRQQQSLREAVIGSASHGLRTPLAAILGSASILAASSRVAEDARLKGLVGIIVAEAERLNGDIQKMLDAASLSADGVRPEITWIEASDLVNAAVEGKQRELERHRVVRVVGEDLPFVSADPALVREALGLLLDNAARYSEPGTTVRVGARQDGDMIEISVEDEGVGLQEADRQRLFEKFYRGAQVRDTTRGSGLGLWIADAFVGACKGKIAIAPGDGGKGTCATIHLVAATEAQMTMLGANDEP